jgi:hypothetical protein
MSQNNNEVNGGIVIAAIFGVAFIFLAVVFSILLMVYSALMTIACLWAWSEPKKIIKWMVYPLTARSFVLGGIAGAIIAPVIVAVAHNYLTFTIEEEYVWLVYALGYAVGANVSGWIADMVLEERANSAAVIDDLPALPAPRQPDVHAHSFEFATWDDEERR